MPNAKRKSLQWSKEAYTLTEIDSTLKIGHCLVKIEENMGTGSILDQFDMVGFKNIYCVRAFKVTSRENTDACMEDGKQDNSNMTDTSTYGEESFIPLHYPGYGTIIPLYGTSHVFKTVEELIMAFPRYVRTEEDLTFCSNGKLVQLKMGSQLELLKTEKDAQYNDKLLCRCGEETLYLRPSDIGRFKVLPDPNLYNLKELLQKLKLPQIIEFKETSQDGQKLKEREFCFFPGMGPDLNFMGTFLLTGVYKERVAVGVPIQFDGEQVLREPFLLPMSMDVFQQLKFNYAFRTCHMEITIKDDKNSDKTNKKPGGKKKEKNTQKAKLNNETPASQQVSEIPFELTYTQYRFPEPSQKHQNQSEKIAKKMNTAFKTLKTKLKRASSKELASIRQNINAVTSPEPARTRMYPVLSASEESADENVYHDLPPVDVSCKGNSRFFYDTDTPRKEREASVSSGGDLPIYSELTELSQLQQRKSNTVEAKEENDVNYKSPEYYSCLMYQQGFVENFEGIIYDNVPIDYEQNEEIQQLEEEESSETIACEQETDEDTENSNENLYMNYNTLEKILTIRGLPSSSCEDISGQNTPDNQQYTADVPSQNHPSAPSVEEELNQNDTDQSTPKDSECTEEESTVIKERPKLPPKPNREKAKEKCETDLETIPLEATSVTELCRILDRCGLQRIGVLCNEHALDGFFLCKMPDDALQDPPFSLTSIELRKIAMMKGGWKPKMN